MTDEPSDAIKLTGTDEPPAPARTVGAGPLAASLEAGALRSIAFGGVEARSGDGGRTDGLHHLRRPEAVAHGRHNLA